MFRNVATETGRRLTRQVATLKSGRDSKICKTGREKETNEVRS